MACAAEFWDYKVRCPECGAPTISNEDGDRWCANVGGWEDVNGCDWEVKGSIDG